MIYNTLASEEVVTKIVPALAERGVTAEIFEDGAAVLTRIKELIPSGVSVMNGASVTLEQIGYIDYLKSDAHSWVNPKVAILKEKDPDKQTGLRKQSVISDWYVGSVHALAETGEFIIASNTASQLPHVAFTSSHIIFVVSTKKIVPTLTDAFKRLEEHVVPLEDKHMMDLYKIHTKLSKILIWKNEAAMNKRTVRMFLVKEDLGF